MTMPSDAENRVAVLMDALDRSIYQAKIAKAQKDRDDVQAIAQELWQLLDVVVRTDTANAECLPGCHGYLSSPPEPCDLCLLRKRLDDLAPTLSVQPLPDASIGLRSTYLGPQS